MNMVVKTSMGTALVLTGLLLAGCSSSWTIKASASCSRTFPGGQTKCTAGASTSTTIGNNIRMLASAFSGESIPDASEYSMDTSGSTIPYPRTGQITVTLKNSSANTVVAAKMFPWTRIGNTISFSNPSAVNSWVDNVANATVDEVDYQLAPFNAQLKPGPNTLKAATKHNGQTLASVTKNICYRPLGPPTSSKPIPPCV
jgi:hypothetical protein